MWPDVAYSLLACSAGLVLAVSFTALFARPADSVIATSRPPPDAEHACSLILTCASVKSTSVCVCVCVCVREREREGVGGGGGGWGGGGFMEVGDRD